MKQRLLATMTAVLLGVMPWGAGLAQDVLWSETGLETDDYKSVAVKILVSDDESTPIGLTEDRIRTKTELVLRTAGLKPVAPDDGDVAPYLSVVVTIARASHSIQLSYSRLVLFRTKKPASYGKRAIVWVHGSAGMHGGDAQYVASLVADMVEEFANEYLKVNAP